MKAVGRVFQRNKQPETTCWSSVLQHMRLTVQAMTLLLTGTLRNAKEFMTTAVAKHLWKCEHILHEYAAFANANSQLADKQIFSRLSNRILAHAACVNDKACALLSVLSLSFNRRRFVFVHLNLYTIYCPVFTTWLNDVACTVLQKTQPSLHRLCNCISNSFFSLRLSTVKE